MNNTQLRTSLISQADFALRNIVEHVEILLDNAQFFGDRYPPDNQSDRIKLKQLAVAVRDLGSLLKVLNEEVERWHREDERILSRLGVETQVINELNATMTATMLFFIMQNMDLGTYSSSTVTRHLTELMRCNRLL